MPDVSASSDALSPEARRHAEARGDGSQDGQNERSVLECRLNTAVQRHGNQTVLFTNAISQQIGLSATEFECLSLLMDSGPLTAGQLGRACGLSSGGVTGLVSRLVKAGFVQRQRDVTDRRRVIISAVPNQELHHRLVALYRPVAQAFDELVSHYSEQELRTMADFIERSCTMLVGLMAAMQAQSDDTPRT